MSLTHQNKVLNALLDQKWDFRTVQGIAKETNLDPLYVASVLRENAQHIRTFPTKNVYTSVERSQKLREQLAWLRIFITKSV